MRAWTAHVVALLVLAALVTGAATGFWMPYAGPGLYAFVAIDVAVAWFLCMKVPANVIGWLLLAVAALVTVQLPADALGRALLPAAPGPAIWLLAYGHGRADFDTWSWILPVGVMFTLIPLFYPTGRLPSRRWRWFAWAASGVILLGAAIESTYTAEVYPGVANPVHLSASIGPVPVQWAAMMVIFAFAAGGSFASLAVRYRRAGAQERAQISWMTWAVVLVFATLMTDAFAPQELTFVHDWIQVALALVPVAMMIAILRFHLYEIDRIISRTVAYALVTAVVVGVYALVVTSATWLLPRAPSLAVAGATLVAAALFLPALRGIQRVVDRRFDRERYDAQKTVDRLGERLRTTDDPDSAASDLLSAVDRSLHPVTLGLWTPGPRPQT